MILSGWGNYPRTQVRLLDTDGAGATLAVLRTEENLIARGNGRSYGDAALNSRATLSMLQSRRVIDFDPTRGIITCEAGRC